jgi:hypothetical protein
VCVYTYSHPRILNILFPVVEKAPTRDGTDQRYLYNIMVSAHSSAAAPHHHYSRRRSTRYYRGETEGKSIAHLTGSTHNIVPRTTRRCVLAYLLHVHSIDGKEKCAAAVLHRFKTLPVPVRVKGRAYNVIIIMLCVCVCVCII